MAKQIIIKWVKRLGLILLSIILLYLIVLLGILAFRWIHNDYYVPLKCEALYNQGLQDSSKSDSIALLIRDLGNREKAIALLRNTAFKGQVSSQVLLGKMYNEDYDKSAFWYLKAAKNGNAEAQGKIGHYYLQGKGVVQDYTKAIYWIKKGADGGNADAQCEMGNLYSVGIALYDFNFVERNYVYLGDNKFHKEGTGPMHTVEVSTERLHELLSNPHDVYLEININKAKHYWRLASSQGIKEAEDALEKVYDDI